LWNNNNNNSIKSIDTKALKNDNYKNWQMQFKKKTEKERAKTTFTERLNKSIYDPILVLI